MKINFTIFFALILSLLLLNSFARMEYEINLEYELMNLVNEFKEGVINEAEFEELVNQFVQLENRIENFDKESNTIESSLLFEKSKSLTSLIGELSPDGRNFDLTIKKYALAAPILGLVAYDHSHPEDEFYCLPIVHFYLWDDNYQALLIVNESSKLTRCNSKTMCVTEITAEYGTESTNEFGVDCYSLRGIHGYFATKEGLVVCTELACNPTIHCAAE